MSEALKKLFLASLLLLMVPGVGWAEECQDNGIGWNIHYDQRIQYQNCRIANALEQIASHLKDGKK